jgi:hypothetical protein
MGTKQIEEKNASQLNFTKEATKNVQDLLTNKTSYTELWYGNKGNMERDLEKLKSFFKGDNVTFNLTEKKDTRDNKNYYVIEIRKVDKETKEVSQKPVPQKEEKEEKTVQVTLSTAAQREVDKIIEGKLNYRELWYGTDNSREEAIGILEKMFKEKNMNISISRSQKKQEGKTFYVISLMNKDAVAQRTQTQKPEQVEKKIKQLITQTKQTESELTKHQNLTKVFGGKIADSLMKWGEHYKVDPYVLASIIVAEHSGNNDKNRAELVGRRLRNNPNAYSKKVSPESISSELSYGLGQFVKPTLEKVLEKPDTFESVIADYDKSIKYMGKFISAIQRANKLTSHEEIAFAYNAGPTTLNNLKKEGGDWQENLEGKIRPGLRGTFFTGKNYIKKVNEAYKELNSA